MLRVLYVCTGNICRSPIAERLLRLHAPHLAISSAGTHALEGYGMDGPSAQALRELGGDPTGHVARWLTESMVTDADLVLTATTAHRDQVLRMAPAALRRTFTMREFARLAPPDAGHPSDAGSPSAAGSPVDLQLQAIAVIADRRGLVDPGPPGGDDIGDPFGASMVAARDVANQIEQAVLITARVLRISQPGISQPA